ncbi:MAG: metalloregulator ArsR/SmtB family transcription factor [Burkholderiaceae bacterium]
MSVQTSTSYSASAALNAAFGALADPTRRAILARLALGETSVCELVRPFAISAPAISRHLRVLESARLIERKVDAQWRVCRLNPPGLRVVGDWLAQYQEFWERSLDRLVEVLEQTEGQPPPPLPSSAGARSSSAARPPGTRARARVRKPGVRHPRPPRSDPSTKQQESP